MRTLEFASAGVRCVAVHVPGQGDAFAGPDGRRPCVVLGHGFRRLPNRIRAAVEITRWFEEALSPAGPRAARAAP